MRAVRFALLILLTMFVVYAAFGTLYVAILLLIKHN